MPAAYNNLRDAYVKMQEAYKDLEGADQKSIRLRYAAFFGCLIGSLMCMRIPSLGFSLLLPCIWCAIAIILGLGKSSVSPITSIIFDILSAGFIGYYGSLLTIAAAMGDSWSLLAADIPLLISMASFLILAIYTAFRLWSENRSSRGELGTVKLPL